MARRSGLRPTLGRWGSAVRTLLLSPHGRIRRGPFWIATLLILAAQIAAAVLAGPGAQDLVYLLVAYPSVCLNTKRLHDLGRSGWIQLAAWIATAPLVMFSWASTYISLVQGPAAAEMFQARHAGSTLYLTAYAVGTLSSLGLLLWLGIARGRRGQNRYGPEPGAEPVEEVFS